MRLVSNVDEIDANIAVLERARQTQNSSLAHEYRSLIKRGTCFLPYQTGGLIAFAPSRFIGYAGNSFDRHRKNTTRDGRLTNRAINQLLGGVPEPNRDVERLYRAFCTSIGLDASEAGTFGVRRKYWIIAALSSVMEDAAEDSIRSDPKLSDTEKSLLINARRGQGAFRDRLMRRWKQQCCVTGCDVAAILRASHIKPWLVSSSRERLDQFNGLLLAPNIDALFDNGLISFAVDGRVMISPKLGQAKAAALGCPMDAQISLVKQHLPYLQYHQKQVFKRS
jgi:hypothetical protein